MRYLIWMLFFSFIVKTVFPQITESFNNPKNTVNPFSFNKLNGKNDIVIFSENFDSGIIPPANWTDTITNHSHTWFPFNLDRISFTPVDPYNKFSAICPYSDSIQNEWLITPALNIANIKNLNLYFFAGYNKNYLTSASLTTFLTRDKGKTWEKIWEAGTDTLSVLWQWRPIDVDLYEFANDSLNRDTIRLAWQYHGKKGDLIGLDGIRLVTVPLNDAADFLTFNMPNQLTEPVINKTQQKIHIDIVSEPTLTTLIPTFTLSRGANANPGSKSSLKYSYSEEAVTYTYTVTAEDPTVKKTWNLVVKMAKPSAEAEIVSFATGSQTGPAVIDSKNRTVKIEVKFGTDLSALTPEITISKGATLTPKLGDKVSATSGIPFEYSVQPQDPKLKPNVWKVFFTIKDYENDIISFVLKEQTSPAVINKQTLTIVAEVEFTTDFQKLSPEILLPDGAKISPPSNELHSFIPGKTEIYTVTAANGVTKQWKIIITRAVNAIFVEHFDTKNSILEGNWTMHTTNMNYSWRVADQERQPFTEINPKSVSSALCPWSSTNQDEWLISDIIDGTGYKQLILSFYAGYNQQWIDSATVILWIKEEKEVTWHKLWDAKLVKTDINTGQWEWNVVSVKLYEFYNKKFQLGWQYVGKNGDLAGIDDVFLYDETPVGIDDNIFLNTKQDAQIFPNPTNGIVYLQHVGNSRIELYNQLGIKYLSRITTENILKLDLTGFPDGMYILFIVYKNKTQTFKVIIKNK